MNTPNESWDSIKITWFDGQGVWAALRRYARRLVREFGEVEELIVFGSLVRGESVPGSDVDVLLILRDHPLPFRERIPMYLPRAAMPIDVDVFPYTRAEIEQMTQSGNFFIRRALCGGVPLVTRSRLENQRERTKEGS